MDMNQQIKDVLRDAVPRYATNDTHGYSVSITVNVVLKKPEKSHPHSMTR